MGRKPILIAIALLMTIILSACGAEIPDLTEEQAAQVADYAAGLLLKYDSHSTSRLLAPEETTPLELPTETVPDENEIFESEALITELPDTEPIIDAEDVAVNDNGEVTNGSIPGSGFKSFLSSDELSLEYMGYYEIVDSYPSEGENAYFAMDASAGNKLLVIHFSLTSLYGNAVDVDMGSYNLRYRVSINGGAYKPILTTMLWNDILSYRGAVDGNSAIDIVAIAEIPEAETYSIDTMQFIIHGAEYSSSIAIK